ncbi:MULTISPECIES: Rcs stress response system protein RcsF [Thalassotalea]|uniref:Rcs stress response system protein RcsF n=1 Tax=Thalassotalea castellviae TaxID=3075612 RepID=A0ABU3A4X2_9GAMM|nr:Rcs stress response system protein RcsF [Thalassotalea sp. W431]MDT0605231.1 Rcs stress response system protein RcsF [Thalassotalea sp. W431]
MNKTTRIKPLNSFLILCFITACSSRYQVQTNLDNLNFKDYYSPAAVTIYQNEQSMLKNKNTESSQAAPKYQYLGAVEGDDCQEKAHHQAPDEINARTNARRKAYDLGANAIIFSGCALIEKNEADKKCLATTVCYGRAYLLSVNSNE